jgi:hypothetical protein
MTAIRRGPSPRVVAKLRSRQVRRARGAASPPAWARQLRAQARRPRACEVERPSRDLGARVTNLNAFQLFVMGIRAIAVESLMNNVG